jgi:hypothetical protein
VSHGLAPKHIHQRVVQVLKLPTQLSANGAGIRHDALKMSSTHDWYPNIVTSPSTAQPHTKVNCALCFCDTTFSSQAMAASNTLFALSEGGAKKGTVPGAPADATSCCAAGCGAMSEVLATAAAPAKHVGLRWGCKSCMHITHQQGTGTSSCLQWTVVWGFRQGCGPHSKPHAM